MVLSTLLTWGGRDYRLNLIDPINEFPNRVPTMSVVDAYSLENLIFEYATEYKDFFKILIVGCGLIYGGIDDCLTSILRCLFILFIDNFF